jgi:recombination protein RecR
MYPKTIQKLIDLFSKFPGVGPKTAARFVFYLTTEKNKNEPEDLARVIASLKNLRVCNFCFKFHESKNSLCEICSDGSRDKNLLCVVEKETDLVSIENNKIYKGLYFILGGTVNSLKKQDIEKLRIDELIQRIKKPEEFGLSGSDFKEIIIATNSTVEGEATALLLERKLKDLDKKTRLDSPSAARRVTRLGRGLPTGGELEYADRETLLSAFRGRG